MASTLGAHNPLRYRGYVYDNETELYYLQSRYYDPQVGRFINADAFVSTGQGLLGNNMFAYCLNNPINYVDFSGNYPICIVTETSTEIVSEDSEGTNYETTITYYWVDTTSPENKSTALTTTYQYRITNGGIVVYNNAQPASASVVTPELSKVLAGEMLARAKEKNPDSLKGRTVSGMAFELQVHFLANMIGFKVGKSNTTDMGASKEGSFGYDYNADWFERPLLNLPAIWNAIFE